MFTNGMKETNASTISLPEDDPALLRIILLIAHMKYDQLPASKDMELNVLGPLAKLCGKDDMVAVVHRVLVGIGDNVTEERIFLVNDDNYPPPVGKILWTTWVFGQRDLQGLLWLAALGTGYRSRVRCLLC
jgi:hypothetical protein